ncbi:MAG: SDR family oxidoreductase [Siculibacillus sp.]|nr:SDR family oxidoreductase [Siculibacillus sp.]
MDLDLTGRTIVVTGGTSGIGLATVRVLLGEGARVAFCGRDGERLDRVAADLAAVHGGDRVLARRCDVTSADEVAVFATAVGAWGGGLDALVNNAGQGRVSTFASTTDANWRAELDLKFFSQILPIRAFRPLLEESPVAAIVAVNSLLSYQPEPHMVCTSAARAGVQNLMKSLSVEFAPKIRVNTIVLGLIESGQWDRRFAARSDASVDRDTWFADLARSKHIPAGRLGKAEEVARAIAFLASPAASYVTGASLEVSGGVSRFA